MPLLPDGACGQAGFLPGLVHAPYIRHMLSSHFHNVVPRAVGSIFQRDTLVGPLVPATSCESGLRWALERQEG